MTLSEQLVSKLACPKCGAALKYNAEEKKLDCNQCKLRFRVTDNIPVLLIDEAEELP